MARDHVSSTDYYSSLLSPFSCKSGQVFGLPKDWNSLGVFYNKQMFQAGGAMAIEGGWLIPYMTANFPSVQYGIAPLPVAPTGKRADLIYTNAWAAYSGTQHADAAWQLIKYMCGQDVQTSQLHACFALPSLKSLANDPYFAQNPGVKAMFDAATYGYADNYGPDDTNIHSDLSDAIEKVFLGKADAQTALNEAAQQINNDLQTGP